jgi:hypothetical protein
VIAQVVLAKLTGGIAQIVQELCEGRRAGLQVRRAAGQLRRDHARAQRMHSGEEGVAPGGAALLGVVVHHDATFVCDPVNVRCFPDHQAAMIAARLHPADIIAHDEQDIGFLSCAWAGATALKSAAVAKAATSRYNLCFVSFWFVVVIWFWCVEGLLN